MGNINIVKQNPNEDPDLLHTWKNHRGRDMEDEEEEEEEVRLVSSVV
jgi:hypothetical protein